jgi:hypothetical protein
MEMNRIHIETRRRRARKRARDLAEIVRLIPSSKTPTEMEEAARRYLRRERAGRRLRAWRRAKLLKAR